MRPSLSKAGRQVWLMVIGAAVANWEPRSPNSGPAMRPLASHSACFPLA
jgi:hypothetical protein